MSVRIDALEGQARAQWSELRSLRKDQRAEYEKLLNFINEKTEALGSMITSNKIASVMMGTGVRVTATIVMTLLTVAGTITGVAVAIKRLFMGG